MISLSHQQPLFSGSILQRTAGTLFGIPPGKKKKYGGILISSIEITHKLICVCIDHRCITLACVYVYIYICKYMYI